MASGTHRHDDARPTIPFSRANWTTPAALDLVIEVADSSIDFYINRKRLLYPSAGLRDYWLVTINARTLLVYRDPNAGDYGDHLTFGPKDSLSPLSAPTAIVTVADLLP